MPRGRFPQPDEIKRRRGNPGRRGIDQAELPGEAAEAGAPQAASEAAPDAVEPSEVLRLDDIECPEFLTKDREKLIFRRIISEFAPRQIAQRTDYTAFARYAVYLNIWIARKETLDDPETGDGWYKVESKHGTRLARHPAAADLLDYGAELSRLELQLGLTPLARQSILRGLGALRELGAGLPFPTRDRAEDEADKPAPGAQGGGASPLAFLDASRAKPN
jgi:P27 family predicted phage terminase small subunit